MEKAAKFKGLGVGDYVYVGVSDVYANAMITHKHDDGVIVVRALKDGEQLEMLTYEEQREKSTILYRK